MTKMKGGKIKVMKKNLVILSLMVMIVMIVGLVSANGIIVSIGGITSPADGTYIGDEVLIEWENGNFSDAMLKYNPGVCGGTGTVTLASHIDPDGEYDWDLSNLEDNAYCIKIIDGQITYYNISVIKDTTAPVIEFLDTPYFGGTSDVIQIKINITEDFDIDEWEFDFGDGSAVEVNDTDLELIFRNRIYSDEGTYTVTLTIKDKAGNEATKNAAVFISNEVQDWIIELSDDRMNMFSIPLMPEDSDIEEVLGEEISDRAEKIWSYQQGSWKYNTPTSSGWLGTSSRIQEIVPGYGYILFMDEDSVLHGKGKALGAEMIPPEVVLTTGWNLIGHYGVNNLPVGNALTSLKGNYNYLNSVFKVDKDGALKPVKKLKPTKAYWLSIKGIDMEDDDELRYFRYAPSQQAY